MWCLFEELGKQKENCKRPRFVIPAIDDTQVETPPGTILFGRTALKERDQNSVATNDPDPPTNPESLGYGERCSHCCQAPCVTVNNLEHKGSRAPDIRNDSQ